MTNTELTAEKRPAWAFLNLANAQTGTKDWRQQLTKMREVFRSSSCFLAQSRSNSSGSCEKVCVGVVCPERLRELLEDGVEVRFPVKWTVSSAPGRTTYQLGSVIGSSISGGERGCGLVHSGNDGGLDDGNKV